MAAPRLRKAASQREFDTLVDDYITEGYTIISKGERNTLLRRKSWGSMGAHIIIFLLSAWWTFLIGNIIYALIAHSSADKVMVKLVQE